MERNKSETNAPANAVRVPHRDHDLLNQPLLNKGTAFTREKREAFGLTGLLPPAVSSTEQQARRPYDNIMRKSDDFERHIG